MPKISPSQEDYLEAIVMLCGANPEASVRSIDVAEKLGVSKPSVTKAITALKEEGYVEQAFYGTITLTKQGLEHGSKVLDRHKTLTAFLHNTVGVDAKTAEKEACLMEHALSDATFKKLKAFIEGLSAPQ